MNKYNQVALWIEWDDEGRYKPMCKIFPAGELGVALKFTESLRRSVYTKEPVRDVETGEEYGTNVSHISIAGDTVGNVTKEGCDVTDSSYNWMKRRSQ